MEKGLHAGVGRRGGRRQGGVRDDFRGRQHRWLEGVDVSV